MYMYFEINVNYFPLSLNICFGFTNSICDRELIYLNDTGIT